MNRRQLILGGLASIPVGVVGYHWRGDILLDPNWTRARGDPAEVAVSPGGQQADAISLERYGEESWETTAEFSTAEAANHVLGRRVDEEKPGLTRGIIGLPFGKIVGLSHDTAYDEDGELVGRPAVSFSETIQEAPSVVTVTVETSGETHSARLPVAVSDGTVVQQ